MKKLLLIVIILGLSLPLGATNKIDILIEQKIKAEGLSLSELCDDYTFLRRASLTLTGRIPESEKVNKFANSKNPNKREELVKELIESDFWVDYQVLKWGDLLRIKAEFPSNILPNGVQAYNRWLREQFAPNVPYDKMVYNLITSTGSNFRSPAVNFFRAFQTRTPEAIAENIAILFTGERTTPQGFSHFFTQLKYKNTNEWKEEIVYVDLDIKASVDKVTMPDNKVLALEHGKDYRKEFAQWLTSEQNPLFARVMANRVWFWLMGRGVIDPVDDITPQSKASNQALLDFLEEEFISSGFDIKALFYLIASSDAFGRSSKSVGDTQKGAVHFAYYPTIRLGSEQLLDALGDITGSFDRYISRTPEPYSYYPADIRAVQLGDGSVTSPQIELFGRPSRDVSLESDRNNNLNSKQVLYLLNSAAILRKISTSDNIKQIVKDYPQRKDLITQSYLLTVSREPSQAEIDFIIKSSEHVTNNQEFCGNVIWALINTTEFLFNH